MIENDPNYEESMGQIDTYLTQGKFQEALRFIKERLTHFKDGMALCRFKIYEAHLLSYTGDMEGCLSSATTALNEARNIGHPLLVIKSLIEIIYARWKLGQLRQAYDLIEEAELILTELEESKEVKVTQADLLNTKGIISDNMGNIREALKYFQASLDLRRDVGDDDDIATSLNNLAIIYQNLGQLDEAMTLLEESLSIKREVGNQLDIANTISNIAVNYRKMGDIEQALFFIEDALTIYYEFGSLSDLSNSLLNKVLFSESAGNTKLMEDAYTDLNKVMAEMADQINPSIQLNFDMASGVVLTKRGEVSKAKDMYRQIINGELIDHTLYILALQYLIELELTQIGTDKEHQKSVRDNIDILVEVSQEQQLFPLHVATLLLKSKLELKRDNADNARVLLYQALRIAEKHQFTDLIMEIDKEIEDVDKYINNQQLDGDQSIEHYIGMIKKMSQQ